MDDVLRVHPLAAGHARLQVPHVVAEDGGGVDGAVVVLQDLDAVAPRVGRRAVGCADGLGLHEAAPGDFAAACPQAEEHLAVDAPAVEGLPAHDRPAVDVAEGVQDPLGLLDERVVCVGGGVGGLLGAPAAGLPAVALADVVADQERAEADREGVGLGQVAGGDPVAAEVHLAPEERDVLAPGAVVGGARGAAVRKTSRPLNRRVLVQVPVKRPSPRGHGREVLGEPAGEFGGDAGMDRGR